ncbi:MAG: hypothetical protein ABWK00_03470 [Desulfurococcaceae archaeon]
MDAEAFDVPRDNLTCARQLELAIAEALERCADAVSDGAAKIVLRRIAIESRKHAEYLEMIGRALGLSGEVDCRRVLGEVWRVVEELLGLSRGAQISLGEFLRRQEWVEGAVGEETYNKVLIPLLREIARTLQLDPRTLEAVAGVLEKATDEEREHEELLRGLCEELC